ncbi:MAG: hypothetical protein HZA48_10435 [Planctomycetes bacterium]|nr:hypothetical protein [Planctomycetota bacterium]
MKISINEVLVGKINKSKWWHVTPVAPDAYSKRGIFLVSTYRQAEFYGRPNDIPDKVFITNPVYGFSEEEILLKLFPGKPNNRFLQAYKKMVKEEQKPQAQDEYKQVKQWYQKRISLDAAMFKKAKSLKYDAIVLMTKNGKKELERNRKPNSIELNLLNV